MADIIQLSRLDEKNSDLPFEEVDLYEMAEDVVQHLESAAKKKNITVVLDKPTEITGTDKVTGLRAGDDFYSVKATFVFRASDPLNSFLPGLEIRGRSIYVDDQAQTNIEGVFAGGDCTGQPWQVNRAAGQGQKAALSAIRYLARRDEGIDY